MRKLSHFGSKKTALRVVFFFSSEDGVQRFNIVHLSWRSCSAVLGVHQDEGPNQGEDER